MSSSSSFSSNSFNHGNMPWVDKHRPNNIAKIVGNNDAVSRLQAIARDGNMPNIILSGPPGTGKTTSILALAHELLGPNCKETVLEMNVLDERGTVVRNKTNVFAQKKVTLPPGRHKIVILDGADSMTSRAQESLRRTMEMYSNSTRFALICNSSSEIIEPIQSRCAIVQFSRLSDQEILGRLMVVLQAEKVPYVPEGLEAIISTADGDMRQALNNLQATYSGSQFFNQSNVVKMPETDRGKKLLYRHRQRAETSVETPRRTHPPPSSPRPSVSASPPSPPQLSSRDNEHPTTSASTMPDSAAGLDVDRVIGKTLASITRPILTLDGEGFLPSHDAANAITKLFKGYYIAPWPSWTKIPDDIRKVWFDKFMGQFSIFPTDESLARRNFERRGVVLLKNNMEKVRKKMKRPRWIGEEVWEGLCRHWQSESFKKASSAAKSNRTSKCEESRGPTHVGGSISTSQHRQNMTKELGVVPSLLEVYCQTHQRKDQTWANLKSKRLMERFTDEMNQQSQLASASGDPPPSELDVWRNVAGVKRGRIYGLGSESLTLNPRPRSRSPSAHWKQEFEEMRAERNQMRDQLASTQSDLAETKQKLEETNQMMQQMMQFIKFNPSSFLTGSSAQQEDRQRDGVYDDADDEEM